MKRIIDRNFFHGIRTVVRNLSGQRFFVREACAGQTAAFHRCRGTVRLYYGISSYLGLATASWAWSQLKNGEFTAPLWPIAFVPAAQLPPLASAAFLLWIFGSLAATFRPELLPFRLAQAVGVFLFVTLSNSDGHFAHNWFAFLWISAILAFLPRISGDRATQRAVRQRYLLVFWGAQFVICVFYLMTGLWKVRSLVECAVSPTLSCELSEKVLTNIAAQEFIMFRKFAPLSWILFRFPWVGFFAYMGTIWIHLISLYFAFRLNQHILFGVLRLIFHLGTFLLFGVDFSAMIIAVNAIFLFSPFDPTETDLRELFWQIPPFGLLRTRRNL